MTDHTETGAEHHMPEHPMEHIEEYGDPKISSKDAKVPLWLIATYIVLPIWGVCSGYYYWNGTQGWLDRGYWHQLQKAAQTTMPFEKPQDEALKSVKYP